MKRGLAIGLLFLLLPVALLAQDPISEPVLVDELNEKLNAEDWEARIDHFSVRIQNDTSAVGLIRVYGPAGDSVGTAERIGRSIKEFMVDTRGIEADRIKVVNGGRFNDPIRSLTQFWIVPQNSKVSLDKKSFQSPIATVAGKIAEKSTGEYFGAVRAFDVAPAWGPDFDVGAGVADVLNAQPASHLYIVVKDASYRIPGRWKRIVDREIRDLQSRGIPAPRIEPVYAGQLAKAETENYESEQIMIEYWVQPEATSPVKSVPVPMPEAKSFDLADYYSSPDKTEKEELLLAVTDTLETFSDFKISFVTRKPGGVESSEDENDRAVLNLPDYLKKLLIEKGVDSSRIGRDEIPAGKNDPLIVHIVLHPKDESPMDSLDI